jgi:hypothetical protein
MRGLQALTAAIVLGIPLTLYLVFWLHAVWPFAIGASGVLGIGVFAIVGTRSGEKDLAADAAWLAAAPDLPPASERKTMESAQAHIAGPDEMHRVAAAPHSIPSSESRDGAPR